MTTNASIGTATIEGHADLESQTTEQSRSTSPISSKVLLHHLKRRALVYVRQSSPQQVRRNRESTALQYNLKDRAAQLGWPDSRIEIIDEDQGISARAIEGRLGFQRLLAEVGLDHVGIILGIEMSRLARSNKDWHQLLELCAIFRTLIADQDGVYDPTDYNDRLLLGLKGTMSEAELHILRARLHEGKLNKARRGELFPAVPTGYMKLPSGGIDLDPDEQVQSVVRLMFEKFQELGSASAVVRYLVSNGIQMGMRQRCGPEKGQLQWRRPCESTLVGILRHPIYAGAYAYGRRTRDPRRRVSGKSRSGQVFLAMEDWAVLRKDTLPAYITWEQFLDNQRQLDQNQLKAGRLKCRPPKQTSMGPVREGPSLLTGLLVCGRCGLRPLIRYSSTTAWTYSCVSKYMQHAAPRCQCFSGRVVDEFVGKKILTALEPAAIELSLRAEFDIQRERDSIQKDWRQKLERARFAADRARRQFDIVEPENRLVARELERRWEESLAEQQSLEREYEQFLQQQPLQLTEEEREQIRSLASAIPGIWNSPAATSMERKMIVRCLIERVVVACQRESELVEVGIHWVGGFISRHEIRRPIQSYAKLRNFDRLKARVEELFGQGQSAPAIAAQLNREGFHPPSRRPDFSGREVWRFLRDICRKGSRTYSLHELEELGENEWLLKDLASKLDVAQQTLHTWLRRGWLSGRQITGKQSHWILWADAAELDRLSRLSKMTYRARPYPKEITTPIRQRIAGSKSD